MIENFPGTRYMGSKEKLIPYLSDVFENLEFDSAQDMMSGTGVVSYLLKKMNKEVQSNDYMYMNHIISKGLIENSHSKLDKQLTYKLLSPNNSNLFVTQTFPGLYYSEEDCLMIDSINNNINEIENEFQFSLAKAALIRSCIKKRPRGIFAYTGIKYQDGRRDLKLSIADHFAENIVKMNKAVFDNKKQSISLNMDYKNLSNEVDLVYLDPPYFSPLSDNEYVRRYHFVEGLAKDWRDVEIQPHTKTKKFKSYPSDFSRLESTKKAFEFIVNKYRESHIVISYSSNSLPGKDFFIQLFSSYNRQLDIIEVDYRYNFANQHRNVKNKVIEYIMVSKR